MADEREKKILEEYEQKKQLHSEYTHEIEELVIKLLRRHESRIHEIKPRLKKKKELRDKIRRKKGKYRQLSDITDICGVRIITYYSDDVDLIAKVIEKEFEIDWENTIDKRKMLDPDKFGYLSLHYVLNLSKERLKQTEYEPFSECKAEIQIRSLLQHGWAEIEHDLGYKSEESVPRDLKRRFSRLAGLLEIADDEFTEIRKKQKKYEKGVNVWVVEEPEKVSIDTTSLVAFTRESKLVKVLDNKIAKMANASIREGAGVGDFDVKILNYVGLTTFDDINVALKKYQKIIPKFAELWLKVPPIADFESITKGISLFYLCYVMLGSRESKELTTGYVGTFGFSGPDENPEKVAEQILDTYNKVK